MYDYDDYYQDMADEHFDRQEEEDLALVESHIERQEEGYNQQQSIVDEQIEQHEESNYPGNNADACDFNEYEMYDAQEHYDEYEDYHHLSEEELYDHFEDQPTVVFGNGHYKIKGEIFMSIWFYKRKNNVSNENSNSQNFTDAKSLSNRGLDGRRIKVKTKSDKFPTVSGYLKNNLDKYYTNK